MAEHPKYVLTLAALKRGNQHDVGAPIGKMSDILGKIGVIANQETKPDAVHGNNLRRTEGSCIRNIRLDVFDLGGGKMLFAEITGNIAAGIEHASEIAENIGRNFAKKIDRYDGPAALAASIRRGVLSRT